MKADSVDPEIVCTLSGLPMVESGTRDEEKVCKNLAMPYKSRASMIRIGLWGILWHHSNKRPNIVLEINSASILNGSLNDGPF